MTIDEAIEQFKYDAECNRADLDLSYAEDNEQIAEWLEELKANKATSAEVYEQGYKRGYKNGYNKAIDDFVIIIKERVGMDWEWDFMFIEQIAEQLKGDANNGTDNQQ